jgi:NAD-dependent SIR2 family protein deacetylase
MANLNPMVYVKLVCHQCSQKYAFDVLPVNNQMPVPVKCPVCKADGTPAANLFLAQKMMGITPQPSAPAPAPVVPTVPKIPSVYDVPSVQISPGVTAFNAANPNTVSDAEWRRRALEAEARAEQAQAALKASLAPQLAESLKEAVVQGLAAQRSELLKAQQGAAMEISELVHRLDELKAPIQERLHSYETRIHELERDLAERNEENRELLKLKIEMTRRQLEAERANSRVNFN